MGLIVSSSSLAVEGQNGFVENHLPLLCSTVNPEVLYKFWKKICKFLGWSLGSLKCVSFLTKAFLCAFVFSILLLMALFGGSVGMEDVKATRFSHFAKSKTGSKGETSHKPWSICASVWIFLVDDGRELLYMNSLSLVIFLVWAIFFFSLSLFWHTLWVCGIPSLGMHLFSFFWHALWACGIPSLGMHLLFLLYSPYIMMITLEWDKHGTSWSFICGWIGDVLAIFQV